MRLCAMFVALCAFAMLFCVPASACAARFENTSKAKGPVYDPFAPAAHRDRFGITIRNTGAEPCHFLVGFAKVSADTRLGDVLTYALQDSSGHDLLPGTGSPWRGVQRTGAVAAGAASTIDVYVSVPPGQFAAPGEYRDQITMSLFGTRESAQNSPSLLDKQVLEVVLQTGASFGVNLAGGGLATTVDFGDLAEGLERSVILETRANQSYRLEITSKNQGHMTLDPPVAGEDWRVNYSVYLNGAPVDVGPTVSVPISQVPKNGESSHRLTFRIGDVARKRAGLYRDTITVKIAARS